MYGGFVLAAAAPGSCRCVAMEINQARRTQSFLLYSPMVGQGEQTVAEVGVVF